MAEYDLVVRNTTIATTSDVVKGDIGITAGRVVALGERLDNKADGERFGVVDNAAERLNDDIKSKSLGKRPKRSRVLK